MTGACPLCGRQGQLERHHPTGRVRGRPVHSDFIFHICGPCNRAQNLMWDMADIGNEVPSVETLLRRIATWLTVWDRPLDIHQYLAHAEVIADLADRARAEREREQGDG